MQGEEGGGTHRTHALEVVLDDGGAADVAGLAQAVEDLCGAVGMVLEQAADIGLVRVELAGARTGEPGAEPGFVEPAAHRASVERDGVGDLDDGELLDAMQMLDALEGGVIDHLVLAICCSTSLMRRAGALRRCVGVAGASSSERT